MLGEKNLFKIKAPEINEDKGLVDTLDGMVEDKSAEEFALFRAKQLEIETKVEKISKYEESLKRFLRIYGIEDLDIKNLKGGMYEIPIKNSKGFDRLGKDYAYKGGMARNILEQELGFTNPLPPRDIDLVRISKEPNSQKDREMALKYCPDDLSHGHGIQTMNENYFKKHDFTINELLVDDNKITLTKSCLFDTVRGIIRFSENKRMIKDNNNDWVNQNRDRTYLEKYKSDKSGFQEKIIIHDLLVAKALRLSILQSTRKRIKMVDSDVYKHVDISHFHIAVHLSRAIEQGLDIAREYVKKLVEHGQLEAEDEEEPEIILKKFVKMMQEEGSFVFRTEILEILDKEEQEIAELDKYTDMAKASIKTKNIDNIEDYL